MDSIDFPRKFTKEELMLKAKYQQLKKIKNDLEILKNSNPEPKEAIAIKRPAETSDTKEVTKKIKSGAALHAALKKHNQPQQSYKRSNSLRRLLEKTKNFK